MDYMEAYKAKFPLHYACMNSNIDDVRKHIDRVNEKDDNGNTPLHIAADGTSLEILNLLIERGANVNALDNDLVTPLHVATGCNQDVPFEDGGDILKDRYLFFDALIDNGADINAKDIEGKTPLHHVCEVNVWKYITYFVDKADLNIVDNEGHTALYHFKENGGSKKRVKYLVSQGAR